MRLEIRWHRIDASLRFAVCPVLHCHHSIKDPSFSSLKRRMCRHLCHIHQLHNNHCRHGYGEHDHWADIAHLTWVKVTPPAGGSNPCRMCWSREYRDVVMGLELCGMCKRSLNQVLNFLQHHGYVVQRAQPLEYRESVQDHQATGQEDGQEPGPRAQARGAGRGSRSGGSSESPQS